MKRVHTISRWISVVYLIGLVFFALRSNRPIPGLFYGRPDVQFRDGGIYIQRGTAYEIAHPEQVADTLERAGKMTLSTSMVPDSAWYSDPSSVITFAQHSHRRNFTLEQDGADLVFRLNTTGVRHEGVHHYFRATDVFKALQEVHVAVTYDGKYVRLYVDGVLHPERFSAEGDFNGWSRDCVLLIGDEVKGGRSWRGSIRWFALFDRVLDEREVMAQARGDGIGHAVAAYDFRSGNMLAGVKPLRYRNQFVLSDGDLFSVVDCLANVAAFVPMAWLLYIWLPYRIKIHRGMAVIVVPTLVGGSFSAGIEFIQQYLNYRVPCLFDLVYNTAGSLLGGFLLWIVLELNGFIKMKEKVA
jgi:VanZ family protein